MFVCRLFLWREEHHEESFQDFAYGRDSAREWLMNTREEKLENHVMQ